MNTSPTAAHPAVNATEEVATRRAPVIRPHAGASTSHAHIYVVTGENLHRADAMPLIEAAVVVAAIWTMFGTAVLGASVF